MAFVEQTAQQREKPGTFAEILEELQDDLAAAAGHSDPGQEDPIQTGLYLSGLNPEAHGLENFGTEDPGMESPELELVYFTEGETEAEGARKSAPEAAFFNRQIPGQGVIDNEDISGAVSAALNLETFTETLKSDEDVPLDKEGMYFAGNENIAAAGDPVPESNQKNAILAFHADGGEGEARAFTALHTAETAETAGSPESAAKAGELLREASKAQTAAQQSDRQSGGDMSGRNAESFYAQIQSRHGIAANARTEGGEGDNSRLQELKSRKGRQTIEVRDLRTAAGRSAEHAESAKGQSLNTQRPAGLELELPVELRISADKPMDDAIGRAGRAASHNQGFEDALARELRGQLSTDIVRNASIIVRNDGEGTIRLSLRPESLGDVKIRLEMTENKITGQIIVESAEAFRAFERELPVLERAFRDSGFSETNLDMFLAQDGRDSGSRERRDEENYPGLSPVQAASRYSDSDGAYLSSGTEDGSDALSFPGGAAYSALTGRKPVNIFV